MVTGAAGQRYRGTTGVFRAGMAERRDGPLAGRYGAVNGGIMIPHAGGRDG